MDKHSAPTIAMTLKNNPVEIGSNEHNLNIKGSVDEGVSSPDLGGYV